MRLIDADALVNDLKHDVAIDQDMLDYEELTELNRTLTQDDKDIKQNAIDLLIHTPTVDAVPVVHGYWKAVTDDGKDYKRICSCCGEEAPFDESEDVYLLYPHCPWCGARNGLKEHD